MRSTTRFRGRLRVLAAALALAQASATPTARAESESLAKTIAYDAAEVWRGASVVPEPATASSAYYEPTASKPGDGVADSALTPTPLEEYAEGVIPASAGAPCSTCNGGDEGGGYFYNRCGCGSQQLFPWFTGPGSCDNWCVGPHWEVAVDGLILFREGVNWGAIPVAPGFTRDVTDQFNYGPGARVSVTGYNENNFGMQVGYEGVNDFHANVIESNVAGDQRAISYESNINSLEVNFVRRLNSRWRPFAGVRYIELDDDIVDFTRTVQPVPTPSDPPAPPAVFVDAGNSFLLDNRMIGLQGGAFRDMWRLNQWVSIEPFGNAGVYLNDFKRQNISQSYTTVVTGDDISTPENEYTVTTTPSVTATTHEFSELAFVGEAGITGVFRLNRCVALRAGYQVLAVNGVGTGIDAFLSPGFDPTTLVYHGGHFGLEYVR
jgi:hypothetical protein